jgi:hypothetical protein
MDDRQIAGVNVNRRKIYIKSSQRARCSWVGGNFFFFEVLGFELRGYTLSHSISPIFVKVFFEIWPLKLFA